MDNQRSSSRRASFLLYGLAVLYGAFTAVGLSTSEQVIRPYVVAIAGTLNGALVCSLLVCAARQVVHGKRVGLAMGVVAYLMVQCFVTLGLSLTGSSSPPRLLIVIALALFLVCGTTFVLVFMLWIRSGLDGKDGARVDS